MLFWKRVKTNNFFNKIRDVFLSKSKFWFCRLLRERIQKLLSFLLNLKEVGLSYGDVLHHKFVRLFLIQNMRDIMDAQFEMSRLIWFGQLSKRFRRIIKKFRCNEDILYRLFLVDIDLWQIEFEVLSLDLNLREFLNDVIRKSKDLEACCLETSDGLRRLLTERQILRSAYYLVLWKYRSSLSLSEVEKQERILKYFMDVIEEEFISKMPFYFRYFFKFKRGLKGIIYKFF